MPITFRQTRSQKSANLSGFTLIELVVTIAIVAVLAGIAIPSFISTITSNRLTAYANELVAAMNLARSEAVKRGMQVSVKSISLGTDWEDGWDVFVDINGDGVFTDDATAPLCEATEDCRLRTFAALPNGYTLRAAANTFQTYSLTGLSSAETFILCNGSGAGMTRRTITINATGRPSVAVTTGTCP
jgi:type IV fimbrial biogenesis protein FimT